MLLKKKPTFPSCDKSSTIHEFQSIEKRVIIPLVGYFGYKRSIFSRCCGSRMYKYLSVQKKMCLLCGLIVFLEYQFFECSICGRIDFK